MPTVVGNMVKETTTTTGTGTIDLDGAPTGFQGFADEFTSGAQVPYTLVDDPDNPNAWETGLGTFTTGTPNTLSRDTVYASSASGSKITLSGTTTVISTPLAAQTTVKDGDNTLTGANTFNGPLVAGPGTELTIATGSITPTGNYHTVDTESDAASDNLDTIATTNIPDGGYVTLRGAAPGLSPPRVVTVRSGISPGNITLSGGASFIMDAAEKSITLQRRSALFVEVHRSVYPGQILQQVVDADAAVATTTTVMPYDDSIPQSSEGAEFMSVTITPKSATSILEIEVSANFAVDQGVGYAGAIFRDATAAALAGHGLSNSAANEATMFILRHRVVAGSTASTTFAFRAGPASAGSPAAALTFNGQGGVRRLGGVSASLMTVREYAV